MNRQVNSGGVGYLNLPGEIRNIIMQYIFGDHEVKVIDEIITTHGAVLNHIYTATRSGQQSGFIGTSTQLYDEGRYHQRREMMLNMIKLNTRRMRLSREEMAAFNVLTTSIESFRYLPRRFIKSTDTILQDKNAILARHAVRDLKRTLDAWLSIKYTSRSKAEIKKKLDKLERRGVRINFSWDFYYKPAIPTGSDSEREVFSRTRTVVLGRRYRHDEMIQ